MPIPSTVGRAIGLVGRRAECSRLDRLIEAVRAGESRALVVHGEAGVGKTELLEYAAGQARGFRIARAAAVQSEMELVFAGLHQLCAPMLDHLDRLPVPQRDNLRTAFGISAGPPPDRFLIGLAVLGLLSDVAEERPLLCLIDDQQWLDRASAQVLAFVARRLGTESVGMIFGARAPGEDVAGLPELAVGGLPDAAARTLLDSALPGPVDARVRDQIVAESRGNPLALLELPRGLTAAEMAGGFGLPGTSSISDGVEDSFRRRAEELPAETRRLLLLAAADPVGDPVLLWRAAERLGIDATSTTPATEAGLAEFGTAVRFRHPIVRAVIYRSAPVTERHEAHRTLAGVIDRSAAPDRRAWHLAQAASGPDEDVAGELERSAGRARARGGLSAAAAFLERAVTLTLDPSRRAGRALAAALAKFQAGAFEAVPGLLATVEVGPLSEFQQAQVDVLRARLAFVTSRGNDAPPLLIKAAERLGPIDAGLSRATYLDALDAAMFAGRLAHPGGGSLEVARAARAAPRPLHTPRASDLLLDGLAAHFTDGFAAGLPILRQALTAFDAEMSPDEQLRRSWLACIAALHVWDDERWDRLSARYIRLAREAGSLSELPLALSMRAHLLLFAGDFPTVKSLTDEVQAYTEATGSTLTPYAAITMEALRGHDAEANTLIAGTVEDSVLRGEGIGIASTELAAAMLGNGLGRYAEAMAAARRADGHPHDLGIANWAAVELVEAAVRSGNHQVATRTYQRLLESTDAARTDWALGIAARCGALLSEGADAARGYEEALSRLGRTRIRSALARTHLLYGEWLRRERRRPEAREHLRTAQNMLEAMGMEAFAERARRELRATGETASKRTAPTTAALTAQEAQIARMARDGLSNPEIATRLFISARTVQYHLRKVFTKLDISSRGQLDRVLP